MKIVLGLLMALNAALFVFGAIQHTGVDIGRFHEPVIVPAAIAGVLLGIVALAAGHGPRTVSNDNLHRAMLTLAGLSLLALLMARSLTSLGRK